MKYKKKFSEKQEQNFGMIQENQWEILITS